MDYEEYQGWIYYIFNNPVGWREDRRTALLMGSMGTKNAETYFPNLAHMKKIREDDTHIGKSLVKSNAFSKMLGSAQEVPDFLKGFQE